MAARLRAHHQEDVRKKIQAAKLINLLQEHAAGKREMSSTQVQSAKILLDKSVSNAPTEVTGAGGGPLTVEIVRFASPTPE
jgi:hypothetical protein